VSWVGGETAGAGCWWSLRDTGGVSGGREVLFSGSRSWPGLPGGMLLGVRCGLGCSGRGWERADALQRFGELFLPGPAGG
jgi:hypothetical protein